MKTLKLALVATMAIGLGILTGWGMWAITQFVTTDGFGQHDVYDNSFAEVDQDSIDQAINATVYVETAAGSGSGTVIHKDDSGHLYILTCAHVIDRSEQVWIGHLGDLIETHVLFRDDKFDLALIKTRLGIANYAGDVINAFADSEKVEAGDATYSVGYPGGIGPLISQGIVSKKDYYLPAYWAEDSILATPTIAPGSSGGGLYVVEDGELKYMGLNQWGWAPLGNVYGFIPMKEVMIVFKREGYTWLLEAK